MTENWSNDAENTTLNVTQINANLNNIKKTVVLSNNKSFL